MFYWRVPGNLKLSRLVFFRGEWMFSSTSLHTSRDQHFIRDLLYRWLTDPLSLPSEDYLTTCFVSAPLIALVQLANYYLFIKLLNISPGEMLKHTLGLTG
jgi:hypothetical protein